MELNSYIIGNVVRFKSAKPGIHAMEMFGGMDFNPEDIEPEEYVGVIRSAFPWAGPSKCMAYLLCTKEGYICVETEDNILGKVNEDEIPEELCNVSADPYHLKDITYTVEEEDRHYVEEKLEEHCVNLTRKAMQALFPDEEIAYVNFCKSSFMRSSLISDLDDILALMDDVNEEILRQDSVQVRLEKKGRAEFIRNQMFKEYYELECGITSTGLSTGTSIGLSTCRAEEGWIYNFMVAIDTEFKTVVIARNGIERSNFFKSLGPEFDDAYNARVTFAQRV